MDINSVQFSVKSFQTELDAVSDGESLKKLEIEWLGRNGKINEWLTELKKIEDRSEKIELGMTINQCKSEIEEKIKQIRSNVPRLTSNVSFVDNTLPGITPNVGHLHPTTEVIRKMNSFFRYYGYSVYEGPEIETEEFNFQKLNLPKDHPARELSDTLYISELEGILLRPHTSSVETRCMTSEKPPIRIIVPGKVYRNETTNLTNNSMFYQYEGLCVDKGISMADLKGTLTEFVKFLYGNSIKTRFRCKYYPQVEPGAGLDIQCTFCSGKGCQTCKHRGFIEVLGSGMVHPNVLNACGIDPQIWSGFAFGMGLDRLVMTQYGITDIRKLYRGELVFS
ncbi:MAG: phenylalanine--tRNA ligase subunit alpha [Patescibacteria group bacterium]